jgi:hypothetical protein
MADEGSTSAALMDIEDAGERRDLMSAQRRSRPVLTWRTGVAAFGLFAFAALVIGWLKRNA